MCYVLVASRLLSDKKPVRYNTRLKDIQEIFLSSNEIDIFPKRVRPLKRNIISRYDLAPRKTTCRQAPPLGPEGHCPRNVFAKAAPLEELSRGNSGRWQYVVNRR